MKHTQIDNNLAQILNDKDISQTELAKMTGISKSQINKFVHGKSDLTSLKINKILNALNIKYSDLYGKHKTLLGWFKRA